MSTGKLISNLYLTLYPNELKIFQGKPALVEPIDFESYILKNKMLIQNDPQRELLLYPPDDVSVSRVKHS